MRILCCCFNPIVEEKIQRPKKSFNLDIEKSREINFKDIDKKSDRKTMADKKLKKVAENILINQEKKD